jgi:hypothetical protein
MLRQKSAGWTHFQPSNPRRAYERKSQASTEYYLRHREQDCTRPFMQTHECEADEQQRNAYP